MRPLVLTSIILVAACSVDEFASVASSDASSPPSDASDAFAPGEADVDAAAVVDASPTPDANAPTFCEVQPTDDAGRAVVACADFDRGPSNDVGWALVDQGMGTIAIESAQSPSPPNRLRALLPVVGGSASATKRIEASIPLSPSATLDVAMRGNATPLSPNQIVTYLSVTPNGSENALGAFHLVRAGAVWRVTATGGNPNIKDLPALAVLGAGWHRLTVVWQRQPMSYALLLDGTPVVTVGGFAIADPTTIVFRVGAWNGTMQAAEPSDEVVYDDVVVRKN